MKKIMELRNYNNRIKTDYLDDEYISYLCLLEKNALLKNRLEHLYC